MGKRPGSQDMVDTPSQVAFEAFGKAIVPEGELLLIGVMFPKTIDQAPGGNFRKGLVFEGMEADAASQAFGIEEIEGGWGDIDIPCPDEGLGRVEMVFEPPFQPSKIAEFVLKRRVFGVSPLRNIGVHHPDTVDSCGDESSFFIGSPSPKALMI